MQANQDLASGCSKKPSITTMELGLVIQFVTGNCYLMKHVSMLEPGLASECRLCLEEEEDSMHLWCECPAIDSERRKILINKTPADWLVNSAGFFRMPPIVEITGQAQGESSGLATACC